MKPVLVIKALPKHWSTYFDTIHDAQQALLQSGGVRTMSMEDAQNVESVPTRPGNVDFEQDITAQGAKSIMPGIARGEIFDQQLLDEGGLFSYRPFLQSFRPGVETYHPDFPPTARLPLRRPDLPGHTSRPQVLVGTLQNPDFHATKEQGRFQTEGFTPVGYDPEQTFLLSDPKKPFNRRDIPEAVMRIALGETKDYAPGTMGFDTEIGRAIQAFNALPLTPQDPLYEQDDAWGKPRTVDEVFRLSEPMDIAFRLLKEESEGQMYNEDLFEDFLDDEDLIHYDEMNDKQRAIIDAKMALPPHLFTEGSEMGERMNRFLFSRSMHGKIPDYYYDDELEYLRHYKDAMESGNFANDNEKTMEILNNGYEEHPEHPHNVAISRMHPDFENRMNTIYRLYNKSEPMDIAFQLLKERVSPEAKRHKLEYDKKYESTPERVKYREELNRERRRRGIYGSHDHKDISHTEGGKLTLEGEHENRARHFKDKGTLREL